jgi:hypothetical protein
VVPGALMARGEHCFDYLPFKNLMRRRLSCS